MASLSSNSTGNFTAAATWSLLDSTSLLDSEAATTASTAAFVSSQNFTTGAITIDGIAIKVQTRSAAPTGTFSVRLFNATAAAAVAGTTVTINITDIIAVNGSNNNGFMFLKFAAPVLLLGATNYNVQITSSTAGQVTLYRDATANNWSRFLRTTTTQAPAATDNLYILGEKISAGVSNSFTVTMDNTTSATTFGAIQISGTGTLNWGTTAATAYYLKLGGNLTIYTNGVHHQGTAAVPMPVGSTGQLEFACTSNVQFGTEVRLGGEDKTGGAVITNSAFLAADAAAAATSLTTNVSTGWKSGDVIGVASTTRTRAESESKALTADAVGTALTITALTNAHSGTGATAGELINLTRNVSRFSTSTTNQTYINILTTCIVDYQSTEFYNMGSGTASKRGIDVGITTGSITINNCSVHDFNVVNSIGINLNSGAGNNYTISNTNLYNIANIGLAQAGTTGTAYTINNIITMLTGSTGISIGDLTGTITSLTGISATGAGIQLSDLIGLNTEVFGTLNTFTAHSNSTIGVSLANVLGVTNNPFGTFTTFNAWRNTTVGVNVSNCFAIIIDTIAAFGNGTANIGTGATDIANVYFKNITANAGTTLTCPVGFLIGADSYELYVDTSTFGATTTHATGDISILAVAISPEMTFRNCIFDSATLIANQGNMTVQSYIGFARFQQTAGNHKRQLKYGLLAVDNVIYNKAAPSTRVTPNNASSTNKAQSGIKKVAVKNGATVTIGLYLRKSVVGDGAAYNGNQPRLILKADPAVGVNSDTVLATADNTFNGAFKALQGVTPAITDNAVFQFYIDCDGTSGWINLDDFYVL